MGLDMWLTKRQKKSEKKGEELGYWRKANQIRGWIANNVDGFRDNSETVIPKDKIEELADICDKVLIKRSEKVSKELLPVSYGFFFGSDQYDEYYYDDVQYTADLFDKILKEVDFDNYDVVYDEWY